MKVPSFPSWIQFEPQTICNSKCITCGSQYLPTMRCRIMDPFVVGKLIDEMAEHKSEIATIVPFMNGEPLLDPTIFDTLDRIAERVGIQKVLFATNGYALPDCSQQLKEAYQSHKIEQLSFSVDGLDAFEKVRKGLSQIDIYGKIHEFLDTIKDKSRINVHMTVCSENLYDLQAFMDYWDSYGIRNTFMPADGRAWHGLSSPSPLPCTRILWSNIYILSDSTVVPCCCDWKGSTPMGKFNTQTIEEIWKGEAYHSIRKAHLDIRKNEITVCRDCQAWY